MPQFSAIKTSVQDWTIDDPAVTVAKIGAWINKAVRDAQDAHNFRHMEATQAFVTVVVTRSLGNTPTLWKEKRDRPWLTDNLSGTQELDWLPSRSEAIRRFNDSTTLDKGGPKVLLELDGSFEVFPFPDGASDYGDSEYRIAIPYWAYLAALSSDADTNWFTDNAEHYLVFAAAAEAMTFNRDYENAAVLQEKSKGELRKLIRKDKRSRLARRITLTPVRDVRAATNQPRM